MLAKKRKCAQQTLTSFSGFARQKESSTTSSINNIPSSVLQYFIFSRLAPFELHKVRGVSKNWEKLTSPLSFLPYFFSYQRLKCGSEPLVPLSVFPTSFESLVEFDPQQIAAPGFRLFHTFDSCVEFLFGSGNFSLWTQLMLSMFMCDTPQQLRALLSSFAHGYCLELLGFLLSCYIVCPCCFGRFSHRNVYLYENVLNCLINETPVGVETLKIPSSSHRPFFSSFRKYLPSKPFTREQRAFIEMSLSSGHVLLASCFAGCGKTSTLVEYALARPNMRILYLCFNKSVQLHASRLFPQTNVCCKTLHSLAWEFVGSRYRHKLQPSLRVNDVMRVMSVSASLATAARDVVLNFLSSCDHQILSSHSNCVFDEKVNSEQACKLANEIWGKMCDAKDFSLPMLHSGYLKLYASCRPVLDYDLIMIDEAQDCDPVIMQASFRKALARISYLTLHAGHQLSNSSKNFCRGFSSANISIPGSG
jgi:hypothetical protein